MRLIALATFIFLVFAGNLNAQKVKPVFVEQKNQGCLEFEPFLAFSYSYARKFNPKLTLGISLQFGYGLRFLLTNPMTHDGDCDQCTDDPGWTHERVKANGREFVDFIKVESFYRVSPSKHIFFDAGLFASLGSQMNSGMNNFAGIEGAAFYTYSAFHLGTKLMLGLRFYSPDTKSKIDYLGLFIMPLVIGINF